MDEIVVKKKKGGKRPGAGRPVGSCNKRTREIADKAIKEGETPLELFLKVMRSPMPPELQERLQGEIDPSLIKALTGWYDLRMKAASEAAPFVHPRLQAIEHKGTIKDEGETNKLDLARRIAYLLKGRDEVPKVEAPKAPEETKEEVRH